MDWAFTARTQPIRIEVKNQRRESTGVIDGSHKGRNYPSWFDDFAGKFSREQNNSLNIACVTTYFEPNDALAERAGELLCRDEAVDAVVVWAWHCRNGQPLTIFARANMRERLTAIVAPTPWEEVGKVILIKHLMRNTAEQRVVTFEEALADLTQTIPGRGQFMATR